jgi:prepilin-type N-terminal cleavage/methylation domain-containing protein
MPDLHPSTSRRASQAGFTLPELMVTLAILGIMVGVAIPSVLAWMPGIYLKDAARDLKGGVIRARSLAINEGVEHRLVLGSADDTYRIERGNLTSGSTVWTSVRGPFPLGNGISVSATTPGIEMSGTDPVLTFGINGSVETNLDTVEVTLENSDAHTYLLGVVRRTGHPAITKGP